MSLHPRPASATVVALLALTALVSACVDHDPRDEVDGDPDATPRATVLPTPAPSAASIVPSHVDLTVATGNIVGVDVTDASGTLTRATSGAPGDGASVEANALTVRNLSSSRIRLTWVGGPCDSASILSIDAARHQMLLIQPECPGDAIATDRILDLEFATPIQASDVKAVLHNGLGT